MGKENKEKLNEAVTIISRKNDISNRDARAADIVSTHVHRMHSVYPIL